MKKIKKLLYLILLCIIPMELAAWPGMPLPALHVEGRDLKDPCGNNVLLHGVALTPSPWFNGCSYGQCRWENYDVQGCLNYNNAVMDALTDTNNGWHLNYIRLHIDPYWTNTPGCSVSENDISCFDYNRLVTYTNEVIIPLIDHARSRGLYVVLRPPGVAPQRIAYGDAYHNYLRTVWEFLSNHSALKNVDNVMFEIANEPIEILGTNGNWGSTGDEHFAALHNYFQDLVDRVRANGANNVCWIPGTGYQSHYQGYPNHMVTGGSIGYAVHVYPGYWGANGEDATSFNNAWNANIQPVANVAPIILTETDWSPSGDGTWGTGTTSGFGVNLKGRIDATGNCSWNLLAPEDLITNADPYNVTTAFSNNWEACGASTKQWFSEYANNNVPSLDCDNDGGVGCTGSTSLSNGTYTITARHSGKSLDVYNFSTDDGGNIVQYTSSGSENQQWIVEQSGGLYAFRSVSSDKCLDVTNFSTADGGNIQQWSCSGNTAQQFCLTDQGDGYYSITNYNSGKCFDISDASTDDGANLSQYSCWGGENQQFLFTPVGGGGSSLVNNSIYEIEFQTDANKVIDLNYGTDANGTIIHPFDKLGGTAQQWVAIDAGNGYWQFESNASATGRVIDLDNADATNGVSIRLWDNYNNTAQSWLVTDEGNGYHSIKSAVNTAKSWDISDCNMDGSANLQLWDYYGTSCQLFKFNLVGSSSFKMGKTSTSLDSNSSLDSNIEENPTIVLYPNPSYNGEFQILVPSQFEDVYAVSIFSMDGKRVYQIGELKPNVTQTIRTSLSKGIYLVRIEQNTNTTITTTKLIIQ